MGHGMLQVSTAFWSSLPNNLFYPMFIVATLAAIIASQALISAVFQIFTQAITQGFLPRFQIHHTSRKVCRHSCACMSCRDVYS